MYSGTYINKCMVCGGSHAIELPCPNIEIGNTPRTEECPGRSQHKCKYCGKCHNILEICWKNPGVTHHKPINVPALKPAYTLEDLYDELGTLKWTGTSDGWEVAIIAVRKHILELIK
jgi:ribosomal protein S14